MGLRSAGWFVSGIDTDLQRTADALVAGALDSIGDDADAELVVLCVPADATVAVAEEILLRRQDRSDLIVTDVSGIKGVICDAIDDVRFIGGHPMAGSEQVGINGARGDLFLGATWVLTPVEGTPPEHFSRLLSIVHSLGAQGISLSPRNHDRLVARVSHLPHLVAASLMNEAAQAAEDDAALLQLAAGGFRDMTRIAAGDPTIWPEVCVQNGEAIIDAIDDLQTRLQSMRDSVESGDRNSLHDTLATASQARRALPSRSVHPEHLAEVRIPVPDQPGVIAEVTATASELGVSIVDLEIAHGIEGDRGVLIIVVSEDEAERYATAVRAHGFNCTVSDR
jgi:prephenate dehydrogenase